LVGAVALLKSKFNDEHFTRFEELFHILEISEKHLEDFLLLAERITAFKAKKYQIQPYTFNLAEVVRQAVQALGEKSLKNKITFEYDLQAYGDCYADKELIEVCIKELIDNAVKYSYPGGKIVIRSFCRDKRSVLEVIDQGQGFPDVVLKHKFKAFITSNDYAKQGTGLDLVLIKLIMEAHSGILEFDNNPEGGAVVRLVF